MPNLIETTIFPQLQKRLKPDQETPILSIYGKSIQSNYI